MLIVPGPSEQAAREVAVRHAHVVAAVPPWRPCTRLSLAFATAERAPAPKVAPQRARRSETQLSLADRQLAA